MVDILADADLSAAPGTAYHGERLSITERLVVSPVVGVFAPERGVAPAPPHSPEHRRPPQAPRGRPATGEAGAEVAVGDIVGRVGATDVRTPFAGRMVRFLACAGERVVTGQPLAWLRVPTQDLGIG